MFGIGMNELMLLIILGLVIIGPKRLPEVARGIGKLFAEFKRATNDLRTAVSDEMQAHPEFNDLKEIRDEMVGNVRSLQNTARDYIEAEISDEKDIAGSLQEDLHEMAGGVERKLREGVAEIDDAAAGPTAPGPEVLRADQSGGGSAGAKPVDPAVGLPPEQPAERSAEEGEIVSGGVAADESDDIPEKSAESGSHDAAERFRRRVEQESIVEVPPERQRTTQNFFKHGNIYKAEEQADLPGRKGSDAEKIDGVESPEEAAQAEIDAPQTEKAGEGKQKGDAVAEARENGANRGAPGGEG